MNFGMYLLLLDTLLNLIYCLAVISFTTLIIPDANDSAEDMAVEAEWLASISPEIPLHISRFFPRYRVTDRPPTPVETVYSLVNIAKKYLHNVYSGNC